MGGADSARGAGGGNEGVGRGALGPCRSLTNRDVGRLAPRAKWRQNSRVCFLCAFNEIFGGLCPAVR